MDLGSNAVVARDRRGIRSQDAGQPRSMNLEGEEIRLGWKDNLPALVAHQDEGGAMLGAISGDVIGSVYERWPVSG